MSGFDERQKGQEAKYVMDKAKEFQAEAKRNKKLGHWAAGLMGLEGDAIDRYAIAVIAADMEEAGDEDVFRKLRKDFDDAKIDVSDTALRDKMSSCLAEARIEVYGQ